jgi:uncharacterized OB-fold protein
MSGRGTVYANTVVHKAMGPWAAAAPYVVAYVELDEGPRILANVVADDPTEVTIGAGVRATFVAVADPGDDGTAGSSERPAQAILRFALTE